MKKLAKKIVVSKLAAYVHKLRKENDIKVVAVVGSIGKTSTKFAVARVLGERFKVQFQKGNYNDIVTVPLIFFGLDEPSLFNPFAWLKTFIRISAMLRRPYPYDVVVVELGVDGAGQMQAFADYLEADITVVSAITPEHMEFFASMDEVAAEEMSVAEYSKLLVVNGDLADEKYIAAFKEKLIRFGKDAGMDYVIGDILFKPESAQFSIVHKGKTFITEEVKAVSLAELYSATAAAVVADQMGLSTEEISRGVSKLEPVSGRMQRLKGINNSLIIDETYNASPIAVKAALDSLYELKAPQKVAILGNMNQLGEMSPEAHTEIGHYCEPKQLDLVITIGPDANHYLAAAAKEQGCEVKSFTNPYDAGNFLKTFMKDGAILLAKGSQNGVFAEEAVKLLLANPDDAKLLVRQSPEWLRKKEKHFKGH